MVARFKAKLSFWAGGIAVTFVALLMARCGTPTPIPTPTLTPTPTPAPTPEPFTPSSVPDARLGIAWISSFYSDALAQDNEHLAVDAGATWDRWPFEWGFIETSPGAFEWVHGNIDYQMAIARDTANGLNTLGIINGWYPQYGLEGWEKFVEAVVSKFGDEVDAWEIGNEGSLPLNPNIDPQGYISAIRIACQVLESHNQLDKPILLGAPDSITALCVANEHFQISKGDCNASEAARWRLVLNFFNQDSMCLDGISLHAYGRPEHSYWVVAGVHGYVPRWDPGVWLTETGVQHPQDPLTQGFPKTSWLGQASYIIAPRRGPTSLLGSLSSGAVRHPTSGGCWRNWVSLQTLAFPRSCVVV